MAKAKGFQLIAFRVSIVKVVPIRNNVRFNPDFDTATI